MTTPDSGPVLVTGATGKQGGATARALLAKGIAVRALTRNPASPQAIALAAMGAEIVQGDLDDVASLARAVAGARAVFSVQMPDVSDLLSDSELVQGRNLVEATLEAGVPQFIHTSVSGAGEVHRNAPGWKEGVWRDYHHLAHYWESKADIEAYVRGAGFPSWTILKPSFFMENLERPSFLFEDWTGDRLLTAILPETMLPMIAVEDIGLAAAEVVAQPEAFNGLEIELAGDCPTMEEVAAVLSEALGLEIVAPRLTVDEAIALGMPAHLTVGAAWMNKVVSPARPEEARRLGLSVRTLRDWAMVNLAKPPAG